MKLDAVSAEIRPRTNWEAIDLGFSLVRQWLVPIWRLWLATVLPIAFVLMGVCYASPLYAVLLIWWLKPLFDRITLFYLSRDLFGDAPTLQQTWRQILGALGSGHFWAELTIYRLSTRRALMLPIHQLEGLTGARHGQRRRAMGAHSGGHATWALIVSGLFEMVLFFGLLLTGLMLIPEALQPDWEGLFSDIGHWVFGAEIGGAAEAMPYSYKWILTFTYLFAVMVTEPFYVGAGFGLYLNARTHLEGWDIELSFKRMTERMAPAAVAALVLVCGLAWSPPAHAQETDARPIPNYIPHADASMNPDPAIEQVLADPDFERRTVKNKSIRFKDRSQSSTGSWGSLGFARVIVWALLGILVAVVVVLIVKYFAKRAPSMARSAPSAKKPKPTVVMGMDVRPGSLPAHLVEEAMKLWRAGHITEALSLLYRGSISRLIEDDQLTIERADTEHDCVRRIADLPDEGRRSYFARLTDTWVLSRYAHMHPDEQTMGWLCQSWPFARGGAA